MFLLSKQLYYCNLLNQVDWLYLHCTIVVSHTGLPRKDETSETFWALEHLFIEKSFLNYLIFPKSLLWQTVMHFRVHLSISFNKNLLYSNLCSVGLLVDWNLACYAYVDCTVHNAQCTMHITVFHGSWTFSNPSLSLAVVFRFHSFMCILYRSAIRFRFCF